MAFDINSIIILATLFVIFGVFLLFDLFKRNERYGYLAYIVAVIPVNYLWYLIYDVDVLAVYVLLFLLWDIVLLRDTIGIYLKKNKEINDMVLYLFLGIIIQVIVAAVLPEAVEELQTAQVDRFLYFYFPDIYNGSWATEAWVNSTMLTAFRVAATLLVLLVIFPLILDIKDEEVPLPMFIIIIGIFILPFLYLSYIWLPAAMGVLTFLLSVILFILLLLITRSGKESS